ncbi:MAG: hypothetical protein CVV50_05085 [Spirochaetae bacterium HGW-Spirochaetae-6]|nr:MAG: hypothetical protein CVV50_05085 [Spirochaetae bacterium HGW-Spirochaetae-6]
MQFLDILTKLGFFFAIAYLNSLMQIVFIRYATDQRTYPYRYAPNNFFPLFSGILLPILSVLALYFPIGYNRYIQHSLLDDTDQYFSKLFALFFQLILSFIFIIVLKETYDFMLSCRSCFYPQCACTNILNCVACLEPSSAYIMRLLFYLPAINLLFILFQCLPFFPGTLGFMAAYQIFYRTHKKKGSDTAYQWLSNFRYLSILLLFLFFFAGGAIYFIQKITFFLTHIVTFAYPSLIALTLGTLSIFFLFFFWHRRNITRYHSDLKKTLENILEKENTP